MNISIISKKSLLYLKFYKNKQLQDIYKIKLKSTKKDIKIKAKMVKKTIYNAIKNNTS